jgi:hypothetical protein
LKIGITQFLSLPKNISFFWQFKGVLTGLSKLDNNSEQSSCFETEVEPVDDLLLGKSFNLINCSSSSILFKSICNSCFNKLFSFSVFDLCSSYFSKFEGIIFSSKISIFLYSNF